ATHSSRRRSPTRPRRACTPCPRAWACWRTWDEPSIDVPGRSPHNRGHDEHARSSPLVLVVRPPGAAARPSLIEAKARRPRGLTPGLLAFLEDEHAGIADPPGPSGVRRAPARLAARPGVDGAVLGRLDPGRRVPAGGEGRARRPARE